FAVRPLRIAEPGDRLQPQAKWYDLEREQPERADPDRRRHQPRQLGWPTGEHAGRSDRHQRFDREPSRRKRWGRLRHSHQPGPTTAVGAGRRFEPMNARLLLVRNGLNGAAPWLAHALQEAGLNVVTISFHELDDAAPADVVLLRIGDHNSMATCWELHKRGHRSVIAVSGSPSSKECIRLLTAGADYYLDAWLPKAELVARVRVVRRLSTWLGKQSALTEVEGATKEWSPQPPRLARTFAEREAAG